MDDWKNSRCFRIDKNMIGEKMENLISVIVPVYNVEPYLKECISSILHQTHNALQVILIDDGSTDGSGEICDQFAKRDDRIEVIHQKNAGVSVARNAGLQRAIGKFVIFTDSDDKLPATAYQDLLEAWTGEDSLVIGRMQYINEEGEKLKLSPEFEISKIDTNTFTRELLEEKKFSYLGYLGDKLFVRNVIVENSLTFNPVIQLNEDRLFILQYSFFCKKVAFCNRIIYLYRQRSDSAIGETRQSSTVLDKEMTVIDAFLLMEQICRSRSETLYYVCVRKAYENILGLLCRVSSKDIEKKKRLTTILWAHCALCMKNPEYKLIDKLKLIIHSILKR